MKGHSLYHRFPLFIIPSGIHHAHPDALIQLLGIMASDLRQLFFEGLDAAGKHYTVALVVTSVVQVPMGLLSRTCLKTLSGLQLAGHPGPGRLLL